MTDLHKASLKVFRGTWQTQNNTISRRRGDGCGMMIWTLVFTVERRDIRQKLSEETAKSLRGWLNRGGDGGEGGTSNFELRTRPWGTHHTKIGWMYHTSTNNYHRSYTEKFKCSFLLHEKRCNVFFLYFYSFHPIRSHIGPSGWSGSTTDLQ